MDEIPESALPFPHRAGNLYKILYMAYWKEEDAQNSNRIIRWVRRLYRYMAPYVSKFPREVYVNYRDIDIGVNNNEGETSYEQASIWGRKYFKNNFNRLVQVKTMVDPDNFFKYEQSIPHADSEQGKRTYKIISMNNRTCMVLRTSYICFL
ncbi:UNVERIFIED_CONTAM: Berberine bridge enzyme-like 24 [Sesamum radiatum]